ncbi:hypothetical protein GGS20DRAFT_587580 [Poronia punctata]|nr:hypothetical protein GGS20DRAFT_587580 [Poronia punctata]
MEALNYVGLVNKREENPDPTFPGLSNLRPSSKTALVQLADENIDLEANNATSELALEPGEEIYDPGQFADAVRAIANAAEGTVRTAFRYSSPLIRAFAGLVDSVSALIHYVPDLSKDWMGFVNRLFDALLRFVSDVLADAVPRTIERLSQPLSSLGSAGTAFGSGFVHIVTMLLSTIVRLVKILVQLFAVVTLLAVVLFLCVWFTGGADIVRSQLSTE